MPVGESLAITLVGVFYVAWGFIWIHSDGRGQVRRLTESAGGSRMPRDAPYGFIPGGVGIAILGLSTMGSRELSIAGLFAALALGEVACVLTWRPPSRMKPTWVREEEARGWRARRMDRWDRGLTAAGLIAAPLMAAIAIVLFTIGPPASPGW
jgi:hypothetical protein